MSVVVALGAEVAVSAFALAGARPVVAETDGEVREAWADLPSSVSLVVLSPDAARALGAARWERTHGGPVPLSVVLPDG